MAKTSQSSSKDDTYSSTAVPPPPKKVTSTKAMEPKAKQPHPRTSEMVVDSIKKLGERGGSSLFAIKKYIDSVYKLDGERQAKLIKKYLKAAVTSGELVQTKGKGASGSFRLPFAKAQAAKRKEAKLEKAEAATATIPPVKRATVKKSSTTASAKPSSSATKLASSKVTKKASAATVKNVKTANRVHPKDPIMTNALSKSLKTKTALPKSPKTKKLLRSPTSKPKAPKPRKVGASAKSPKSAATSKKTVAAK